MHGHTEKGFAIPAHAAIKHVPCFSLLGRAGVPFREAGRSAGIRTDDETHGAGHEPVGLKLEDRLYMVSGASIFSRCSALPRTVRAAAHRASRA